MNFYEGSFFWYAHHASQRREDLAVLENNDAGDGHLLTNISLGKAHALSKRKESVLFEEFSGFNAVAQLFRLACLKYWNPANRPTQI